MNDEELDRRFAALPTRVVPPAGVWHGVAGQLGKPLGNVPRRRQVVLRVAAAILIFVAGAATGRTLTKPSDPPIGDSAFLAAVQVQQAGSALVHAVMVLDAAAVTAGSAGSIGQGREVMRSTVQLLGNRLNAPR